MTIIEKIQKLCPHDDLMLVDDRGEGMGDRFRVADLHRLLQIVEVAIEKLEHYGDSNNWACEQPNLDHEGRCTLKLYRGSLLNGYGIADEALAKIKALKEAK